MITGVVLAGGTSSRYGRNKALDEFHGERLVDRCVAQLSHHTRQVMLIANDLSPYYSTKATLVQDILPQRGPLGGILTALVFSPHDWVFVKAADMPFLSPGLFPLMMELMGAHDVVVPVNNGHYEPLLALYHRRCLAAVLRTLQREEHRVVASYKKLKVRVMTEKHWQRVDPEGISFRNINTRHDMIRVLSGGAELLKSI